MIRDYDWKRFWCCRGSSISLGDNGFLSDPDGKYGHLLNPALASLDTFAQTPCLILLGEPGIGKTTEYSAEVKRAISSATHEDVIHTIDLREYNTDIRLIAEAFENDVVRDWKAGSHNLTLFFDSLDEGALEIRAIAGVISKHLAKFSTVISRLRLRIACRTAEWPSSLETALIGLWGKDKTTCLELAPLRRVDIAHAAEVEGADPIRFLHAIFDRDVQSLAVNPITLKFLLTSFAQSGVLPHSKQDLYESGCARLVGESNKLRQESRHAGTLSTDKRLEIAGRIAAYCVLTGRSTVDLRPDSPLEPSHLSVSTIAGGVETRHGVTYEVTEEATREVLNSALFSGRQAQCLGFAHWTYAEYLTARYLTTHGLDKTQLFSLIFHPESIQRVIPQLAETAAWASVRHPALFEELISHDPQVLLRSDVARLGDLDKERLVASLLEAFRSGAADDSDWNLRPQYAKLAHPKIASQLRRIISDKTQLVVTRRFAIDLAEDCNCTPLVKLLLTTALSETEDLQVRVQAACAAARLANDLESKRMLKLAVKPSKHDHNDELKGYALSALWSRKLIATSELFELLTEPRNKSFFGRYISFLHSEVAAKLSPADLPDALEWIAKLGSIRGGSSAFEELVASIAQLAVVNLYEAKTRERFGQYVLSRIKHHDLLHLGDAAKLPLDDTVRHQLLAGMFDRVEDPRETVNSLIFQWPELISKEDYKWALARSATAKTNALKRRWAKIAFAMHSRLWILDMDTIVTSCESNAVAASVFAELILPVRLDSPQAAEMRKIYESNLEFQRRIAEHSEDRRLNPPPSARIADCVKLLVSGDLNGWWQLNQQLQLDETSTHYSREYECDMTKLPGWVAANDALRRQILGFAKQYLRQWRSKPKQWIGKNITYFPDAALFRALVLVDKLEPGVLATLSKAQWESVAPTILGFSGRDTNENLELQWRLGGLAFEKVPETVVATVNLLFERDVKHEHNHIFMLRTIEGIGGDRLTEHMSAKLSDRSLSASQIGDLLEWLFHRNCPKAIQFAKRAIRRRSSDRSSAIATKAAVLLWTFAASGNWRDLWLQFSSDRKFFREVVLDLSYSRYREYPSLSGITELQLADLYLVLLEEFPPKEDPESDGFLSPRESAADLRRAVLASLENRGTVLACAEIERLQRMLPKHTYLAWALRSARRKTLRTTWRPMLIAEIRQLIANRPARLVRTERELQKVILESLARLQSELRGEMPSVRDIWDKGNKKWRPVDEKAFSSYVARHIKDDLRTTGIISLLEVEIRPGNERRGERTDIYVAVKLSGEPASPAKVVHTIIEVKGCWHPDVLTGMKNQLLDRYLRENPCETGIYVVGWFTCRSWDSSDSRKKRTPRFTFEKARELFSTQAEKLSTTTVRLEAVTLNCGLI